METATVAFHAPLVLRVLCYLAAMALFAAENIWLLRRAYGVANSCSLKTYSQIWLLRILAACAFLSLGHTFFVRKEIEPISMIFPELAILCLVAALYLLAFAQKPIDWREIFFRRLPKGLMVVLWSFFICCALWGLAFALGWAALVFLSFLPPWTPFFLVALFWNAPLIVLFLKAGRMEDGLKFQAILKPVLIAYFLVMFPDILEHAANHPKIIKMLHPVPNLPRI